MGRHLHIDPLGGVAGDMITAALLDALPEAVSLALAETATVVPVDRATVTLDPIQAQGLAARAFRVTVTGPGPARHTELARILDAAAISPETRRHALAILERLARVEAEIHDVPLSDVHFHEIAGWDTLADITAVSSVIGALAETTWSVGALPLGGGVIKSAHGLLPVPAPATVALLKGFDWRDDGIGGERVTPTGAAILAHVIALAPGARGGRLIASGVGAGTRVLPGIANVTRVLLFDTGGTLQDETIGVIEFEIDDMTGEEIATALDHLRATPGVLDASHDQRLGKKGRPMFGVRVLAEAAAVDPVLDACFLQTSTLGARHGMVGRRVLARHLETRDGLATKRAERPDGRHTIKAENDGIENLSTLALRRRRRAAAEDPNR